VEATYVASGNDVVFFGATIGRARRVRIGKVASVRTQVPRNRIVALDRRGRLLGRQHWRDKHGHYGRCDGIWDRKQCPRRPAGV
jgi:hypothetical protein